MYSTWHRTNPFAMRCPDSLLVIYCTFRHVREILGSSRDYANFDICHLRGAHHALLDVTTKRGDLFRGQGRRECKGFMLDFTVAKPCESSNLEKEVKTPEFAIVAALTQKINEYRDTFPAIYTLLPLAVPTCRILNSDPQA